ncbi:MAG: ABC-F family ATP-binding cassette domain-containing protein [Clostridia bacterium]|nr:ABC-F family ATP-binding cassette domain-containing protein [Clostridia bacterium]
MAEIVVSGIEKSFEQDRVVLDDVSFQVEAGERVGLLGPNGAGKTTLLRIMTGELAPDKGFIAIPQGRRVGYISQLAEAPEGALVEDVLRMAFADVTATAQALEEVQKQMDAGLHSEALLKKYDALTTRFDMLGGYDCETRLSKVANGLHISPDQRRQPFSSLSGGEQTRIRLAVMILRETDILLLDEPTNHLDMDSIEWLENYLDHYKGTVLAVSHDRFFLDRTVTRIVELDHGGVEFYSGNYSFYVVEKEARYKLQMKQYEKEQAKIAQLEKAADQLSAWAYSGMDKTYKRVVAIRRRIEWLHQTEKPTREERLDLGFPTVPFRADYALRVKGLKKSYGSRTLFENVTQTIRGGGERVALVGANGAGKTTLLKILLGEESADDGIIEFGPSVRAAYLPQQIEFAHPERTLYDTLLYELGCEPQQARNRLGAYRFRGEDQFKRVSQLSGGERARLKLCMLMNSAVNMLILDEPTNHLDLDSREWIESAVDQFEGTLLIVSHDRYFVNRFATRIWELDEGELRNYDCGYKKYRFIRERELDARQARQALEKSAQRQQEKAKKTAKRPAGRKDGKTERRMAMIERDIARLEQQSGALDAQMEENASDYVRLGELQAEKDALQERIDALYMEWDTLGG